MTVKFKPAGESLAAALTRVQPARAKLSNVSDRLNTSFTTLEDTLASLKLGVRAYVRMHEDDEDGSYRDIAFGKYANEWRLLYETGNMHSDEAEEVMPLVSAPRWVRQEGARYLGKLVLALAERVEEEANAVEESIKATDKVTQELIAWRDQNMSKESPK